MGLGVDWRLGLANEVATFSLLGASQYSFGGKGQPFGRYTTTPHHPTSPHTHTRSNMVVSAVPEPPPIP